MQGISFPKKTAYEVEIINKNIVVWVLNTIKCKNAPSTEVTVNIISE